MDGIAGIYGPGDNKLVHKLFLATGMCQHRGKACAGIAVSNGKGFYIHNGLGRIGDVVDADQIRVYQDLGPIAAIGNVGYTKNRIPERRNVEPIEIHPRVGSRYSVVLTMDGYVVNRKGLRAELEGDYSFETGNETEVVGALLHQYITREGISFEAGREVVDRLHGRATFALTALVHDGRGLYMIALNDGRAFEPFCHGNVNSDFVVASESCSIERLGGVVNGEYDGTEMSIFSKHGHFRKRLREEVLMPDIFQSVYFGNAGALFRGREIYQIRNRLGRKLVERYGPAEGDVIIPNPESGWGVTVGVFEATLERLKKMAFDYSQFDEGVIRVRDRKASERYDKLITVLPALIKLAQAVRTFQEAEKVKRFMEAGLKFGAIRSLLNGKDVDEGDDSIVKGCVGEGGSVWAVKNAGARRYVRWISYGPMFFPSFKEWHSGRECLEELAVQRAFEGDNPYDKSHEEVCRAVARLTGVDDVRYNEKGDIEEVTGPGSFQALDASYPIAEEFWPDWLKREVERFHNYR